MHWEIENVGTSKKKFKNVPTNDHGSGRKENPLTEIKIAENEHITRFARLIISFNGSS